MDIQNLSSAIEAIFFAADRPVTLSRLKEVLGNPDAGPTEEELQAEVNRLKEKYQDPAHGFELREAQGGYHFCTKVENAAVIQKFLATKPFRLGRSALETLSIVAYRQPITRAEIDAVRGIDSSHLLRVLIERGLVRMVGKAEIPGRPVQYGTTPKFLETLGLKNLVELPPLTELSELQGDTEDPTKALEAGLDRFVATTDRAEEFQAQATEGLKEIDDMISQAAKADTEVYASKEAEEIAASNREAVEAFQAFTRPKRTKKTVTFEKLSSAPLESPPTEGLTEEPLSNRPVAEALTDPTPAIAADPDDDGTPPLVN